MTSSMNPRGLFGTCPLCHKPVLIHEKLDTVLLGVPQTPYVAHKECVKDLDRDECPS